MNAYQTIATNRVTGGVIPQAVLVVGLGSYAYGKERRAVTALKHMPRIQPHFLTTIWEDGTVRELLERNHFEFTPVTIGYLGRARLGWTLKNILLMPSLFVAVLRKYRSKHCRGVLVLALQPFANLLPALWFMKTFWGAHLAFYLGDIPANTRANKIVGHLINRQKAPVVAISSAVKAGLECIGIEPSRISVVLNGVDLQAVRSAKSGRLKERFSWPANSIIIGYVGQLTEQKGIADFITAAKIAHREQPNCRFVVFGELDEGNSFHQSMLQASRSLSESHVLSFVGYSSDMLGNYHDLDIVVMPSRHQEALGNVAIEAAAAGVPVIASNVGGIPETVVHGRTGFLVDREEPVQIAKYVAMLAANSELHRRMSAAAREHAEAIFDIRKNAPLVEEILFRE